MLLFVGGNGLVVWVLYYVLLGVMVLIIGISLVFFVLIEWVWSGG